MLHTALQRIRRPLEYSAKHDFANIDRVRDLEHTITNWVDGVTSPELTSAHLHLLEQFKALFSKYDDKPSQDKIAVIQAALRLVDQLDSLCSASDAHAASSPHQSPASSPPATPPERASQASASASQRPERTTPIQFVKGVGPKRARLLHRMNLHTVEDALLLFPRRYEDRRHIRTIAQARPGEQFTTIYGIVKSSGLTTTPKQKTKLFELLVSDDTGTLTAKWFNQGYLKRVFKRDMRVVLSGKISMNWRGGIEMIQPEFEILNSRDTAGDLLHTGRIVPIYPLTEGLYQKDMRKIMYAVVEHYADAIAEELPEALRQKYRLLPLTEALRRIHFPEADENIELLNRHLSPAHERLIFDEFFLLELGMGLKRLHVQKTSTGIVFEFHDKLEQQLRESLPFNLTTAQERVVQEIKADMRSTRLMNRLLQGDVGSGKTIVALIALLSAIEAGYQSAIMVPTEILAEQHFQKLSSFLQPLNRALSPATPQLSSRSAQQEMLYSSPQIHTCLLSGGLRKKEREERLLQIERGEIQLIIGTHALIQHDVAFHKLGLVVIDEQHKFGVMQRATLRAKGYNPDVLIMTATPIPRTLSLTIYGDLDVSIIDELPPGRTPIITKRFYERNRESAYRLIAQQIEAGRQAYIVYPLVEESEHLDLKAATKMAEHLRDEIFPQYRVGLVHGRLKAEDKEAQMIAFKAHELDILVSTTVLEVGIDVPNATVMVIEHAERFGLSQLHQLRGRVGRGSQKSYCLLMTAFPLSDDARRRLDAMVETTDGFLIAERDLEIRGPGEFFGTKQSGLPDLKVANLVRDVKWLEYARREAFALIAKDPGLRLPQHQQIKIALEQRWHKSLDLISVG